MPHQASSTAFTTLLVFLALLDIGRVSVPLHMSPKARYCNEAGLQRVVLHILGLKTNFGTFDIRIIVFVVDLGLRDNVVSFAEVSCEA